MAFRQDPGAEWRRTDFRCGLFAFHHVAHLLDNFAWVTTLIARKLFIRDVIDKMI
jgi:hypothetical protein